MLELDRRLAVVAEKQHSLIQLSDVIGAGGSQAHASTRVRAGRWDRAASSGVFRLAGVPWTYEARVLAAVMAAGPGAVASHLCAARLLGIGFPNATPELSIPRGRHHRPDGVRVHQSTDLDRCGVRVVAAIPITEPARTLLDLGRYIGPNALYRAVEHARRLELVTWADLVRCLARHARQGRHGITRLRAVIEQGMPIEAVTDTDSELMALSIIRGAGLPEPTLHHQVRDADGELLAEIDLAFVSRLVGIEIDGGVHLDPEVRKKDDARDHELRRRGWTIRRVWHEIPMRQSSQFVAIVRHLLADAPLRPGR